MNSAMCAFIVLALVASVPAPVIAVRQTVEVHTLANPIRKVVTMLQSMQKKVIEEGEAEHKLYSDFMCYCKTSGSDLGASVVGAETKVPTVSSALKVAEEKLAQTKSDLKGAQEESSAAKAAMAEGSALREKEAAAYARDKACYESNVDAITKAVAALEKGVAGGFLQTEAAEVLRQLVAKKQETLDSGGQDLLAFLSAKDGSGYVPKSHEIIGILKQLGDEMAKGLSEATAAENAAIHAYEALMAAKTKELAILNASLESKIKQCADLDIEIVAMKEDLSDTEAALLQDTQCLNDLKKACAAKTAEWEERSKTRSEELLALAETIKLLSNDDALELFKKTLPSSSASFVQMQTSTTALRARVVAQVQAARQATGVDTRTKLDLLVLALSGKRALGRAGFEKVIEMCDKMIETLNKEQQEDDHKKEYCIAQFDTSDDSKKALEHSMAEQERAVASAQDGIAALTEELTALKAAIKTLDTSVAEATEQRKAENAEFKELMASNTAAKELLGLARNRLRKFYEEKLAEQPAKADLTAEDQIVENLGGAVLAQVSEHTWRRAPPAPPASWGAYAKKSEETTGVVAMLDLLCKTLDKEMAEGETEEKDAQAEYELMMKDAAAKRAEDAKSVTDKEEAKAELEAALEASTEEKAFSTKLLMTTQKFIQSLHASCDWLLQYFDMRKEARANEVDALKKAKAVLSGADLSFVQMAAHASHSA